jgi:hypothetical protein
LPLLRNAELAVLPGIDADGRAARTNKPGTPPEQEAAVKDEPRIRVLPKLGTG